MGRTLNVFKLNKKRIEYTDAVKAAVLNPRITGLRLHMNGGWDWIDQKYGFIKLLLSRGQIREITTHQDLLACVDYMDAMAIGRSIRVVNFDCANAPLFGEHDKKRASWASKKRMAIAHKQFTAYMKFTSSEVF